jgi:hypothetical protein
VIVQKDIRIAETIGLGVGADSRQGKRFEQHQRDTVKQRNPARCPDAECSSSFSLFPGLPVAKASGNQAGPADSEQIGNACQ